MTFVKRMPWRGLRRAVQFGLLILFLVLFRRTAYLGSDELPGGENLFFRLDPLVGAAATLSAREILPLFWPAALIVVATLVFGRFFCGWVCPLGTLLDIFHRMLRFPLRLFRRRTKVPSPAPDPAAIPAARPPRERYAQFLLAAILVAALFGLPLVGWFDPFALLVRGLAFWGDAVLFDGGAAALAKAEDVAWLGGVSRWVSNRLMPFQRPLFDLAGVAGTMLGLVFLLELVGRRFWCRHLCPLGAGLGLVARRARLKRLPTRVCHNCRRCQVECRMGALDGGAGFSPEACNLCMDCQTRCDRDLARFTFRPNRVAPAPVDLSRRGFLAAAVTGVALPVLGRAAGIAAPATTPASLLRPPGAGDERRFLDLCIRCGECMKVCPTNVLQPVLLEAGLEGIFTPRLDPRSIFERSYCEYHCTLCGQVCPTGAIPRLTEDEKHERTTAKAYFDHDRCLPWAKDTPCIRCEEMCPVADKAILLLPVRTVRDADGREVEILQPYVDRDRCVGCGICESNCPLEGAAGVRLVRTDSPDPGTETRLPAVLPNRPAGESISPY